MPNSVFKSGIWRLLAWVPAGVLLFCIYIVGIWENPPGFYIDESALSFNAYLVSQTGAGEFGSRFPLYFQIYAEPFTQWSNPTQIYLLAVLFKVFGPGILTAKLFAAACVFAACILLGFLARRISGSNAVGIIVGASSLLTPWLFEVGRLVMETFFYPMAVVLLLWSVYRASAKQKWRLLDTAMIALSLTLLTYSYTIGRLLGPLLAAGLVLFATSRERIFSVARVWLVFGITLIPLAVYVIENPAITTRFRLLSYIKPNAAVAEIAGRFVTRFAEDVNPLAMLVGGDVNPRHHLPGPHGSFYFAVFLLAVIGVVVVLARHRRKSWWLYILFGLMASAVPGALTNDPFHSLRMIAYPIFLITLTIPALSWLLGVGETSTDTSLQAGGRPRGLVSIEMRYAILTALLTVGIVQAGHFFWRFHTEGTERAEYFDATYKPLYDHAVAQSQRPIYLVDGYWGPAYIHAFWYATVEGRDPGEFVHLPQREQPPDGALVLSSEHKCRKCEMLGQEGVYLLYIKRETKLETVNENQSEP